MIKIAISETSPTQLIVEKEHVYSNSFFGKSS